MLLLLCFHASAGVIIDPMTEWVMTAAGIQALDTRLDAAGLLELAMEEAGRATADLAQTLSYHAKAVVLLAGAGANGGDALVAARHLHAAGYEVVVLAAPSKHPLTQRNRERLEAVGVATLPLSAQSIADLPAPALWVDGLVGTGLTGDLHGDLAEVVAALNERVEPVLAIDLPSGLIAERSGTPALSVRAAATLALSGYKAAHLFGAAAQRCGKLALASLALPPDWAAAAAYAQRPLDGELARLLPERRADAHKGTAGRVWVVGGSAGMEGAPTLCGMGALRTGAGLVTLHSAAELPLPMPELMRRQHPALLDWLQAETARPDVLALGMGLPEAEAVAVAREVLRWQLPTVLDAGALHPDLAGSGHAGCLWTPHPGEAARMLTGAAGWEDAAAINADPLGAAQTLQERYGGTVVLKGGPSVVAWAGGLSVSRGGHPGMASAGMGDTLAGILAALLAAGLAPHHAAQVGVRLHARAGERAAVRFGYGLSANDVAAELGAAWADLTANRQMPL